MSCRVLLEYLEDRCEPVILVVCVELGCSFGFFFFFQAEDGIRDYKVTGVQTCALPISARVSSPVAIRLRLRFSIWHNGLPVDALPVEGWMELQLLSEENLMALGR